MDSLKLDRFRRLLNRQNTSINLGDGQQQPQAQATAGPEHQQSAANHRVSGAAASSAAVLTAQSSFSAISVSLPEYIIRDNPKPAHFIARKLFCDFTELAHRKIDVALSRVGQQPDARVGANTTKSAAANSTGTFSHQHSSKTSSDNHHQNQDSIFKSLRRDEDLVYDQVLKGLGTLSEHCLPSLLKYLLLWYHQQLDAYADRAASPPPSTTLDDGTPSSPPKCCPSDEQQHQQQSQDLEASGGGAGGGVKYLYQSTEISSQDQQATTNCDLNQTGAAECGCTSPCNNEPHSSSNSNSACANHSSSLMRTPTPASPDLNQIAITSTLPLEYQSPAPQTTIIQKDLPECQSSSKDAANTSASTATNTSLNSTSLEDSINQIKRSEIISKRSLLVEYAFCQALIEIFSKLYLHPGHEDLIGQVEEIAFEHFRYVAEADLHGLVLADVKRLADKYAEVIGVLAQTRFRSVKKRFLIELAERKTREPTTENIQSVCSLLIGMRSFRIKMAPIEEFEASFHFLQELADYFVEVRHKSIKHALAELFVEVLLPLASIVKNEVKIPCLKNFVDTLWAPTLDMSARKKHSASLFPLVTCLLCVSQRALFLANWGSFLNMCLSNLKNRDQKMCRIALESLYRLTWIYMIRIKGESNNVTQARLSNIVDTLFPRGSRQIVPRETPLVIFVDIIQFIAQERLDFAMRHIIFDLLSVDRSIKMIMAPERMNIGLQAFLVIADSLQQKEGDPAMPISIGSASAQQLAQIMHPSSLQRAHQSNPHQYDSTTGSTYSVRGGGGGGRNGSGPHRMLNDETAKSIGLHPYYNHIQKSFNEILKALDAQFGRPLMLTSFHQATSGGGGTAGGGGGGGSGGAHISHKEPDAELISGDRRLRVDLFKTCIAAIPRLMPDGMSKGDLIDLLARMTIHIDEEMRRYAFESLRKLVVDFQDWRLDAIEGFTLFLANQLDESQWNLVDNALKMLLQLLISWHSIITSATSSSSSSSSDGTSNGTGSALLAKCSSHNSSSIVTLIQTGYETISSRSSGTGGQIAARKNRALAEMRLIQSELGNTRFDRLVNVIQKVEGASLVMLCSCHSTTRKLASLSLRECRAILRCYSSWTCMEQFGFRSPADEGLASDNGGGGLDGGEDNLSASLKGSLSADNLSRITTNSINGLVHSSMTSINTQAAMLSTSVSKMCIGGQSQTGGTNAFNTFGLGARSASVSNNNNNNNNNNSSSNNQHDLYDEDIENNLADCHANDESSSSSTMIFWVAVMMLESNRECEYAFALRLLKKILPNMPMGRDDFLEELERNLKHMQWDNFPGLHALVLKGCSSPATYDLCISLLDHMTPILGHPICTRTPPPPQPPPPQLGWSNSTGRYAAAENSLPAHVLVLSTYLLATYEDPSSFSLNIARRLALCCEENSSKLENLAAVMTLYSRRSFSKDAFQWIKCVAKYLHDACPDVLPRTIPLLLDMLVSGPHQVQRLILPILYCILTYAAEQQQQPTDVAGRQHPQQKQQQLEIQETDCSRSHHSSYNEQVLMRIYNKCLGSSHLWRDALQIFRLIISKSSTLAASTTNGNNSSSGSSSKPVAGSGSGIGASELPGRTMEFNLEIDCVPIIAKGRLAELGIFPNAGATTTTATATATCQPAGANASQSKCQQQALSQQHSIVDESQA